MEATTGMSSNIILQMKQFASDEEKATAIVKDETCLGGLVMVLSNPDEQIVKLALETIQELGQWPRLKHRMKSFIGMAEQLQTLMSQSKPFLQSLASSVYDLLFHSTKTSHRPLKESQHQQRNKVPMRSKSVLLSAGQSKTIILHIKGMHDKDDMELCRSQILTVKGVISITFNFSAKRAILRVKPDIRPEVIAVAIAKTMTMAAEHVIKLDNGQEEIRPFNKPFNTSAVMDQENLHMPDYPSDTEDSGSLDNSHNIAPAGAVPPADDNKPWEFVKKVGSFLSNSFYW